MAANAQCVTNKNGDYCVIQSSRGFNSLTFDQKCLLTDNYTMVVSEVDTIEIIGGGSCRCMLVENWTNVGKTDFKVESFDDDFFELGTSASSYEEPCNDKYWDQQFFEPLEALRVALAPCLEGSNGIKIKEGKKYPRSGLRHVKTMNDLITPEVDRLSETGYGEEELYQPKSNGFMRLVRKLSGLFWKSDEDILEVV